MFSDGTEVRIARVRVPTPSGVEYGARDAGWFDCSDRAHAGRAHARVTAFAMASMMATKSRSAVGAVPPIEIVDPSIRSTYSTDCDGTPLVPGGGGVRVMTRTARPTGRVIARRSTIFRGTPGMLFCSRERRRR